MKVFPRGRKKWIVKKLLEEKSYSHLDTLLDDVIKLQQTPHRLGICDFELPDSIPKNCTIRTTTQAASNRCTHNKIY